jgi:uncharacterized phage protein gp47/JayE
MALNLPSNRKEVKNRMEADIKRELSGFAFLKNSVINALTFAWSGAIFDIYRAINNFINNLFLQTASNEFLDKFGYAWQLTRNPATQASGNISITGLSGSSIPIGTQFQSANGDTYETQETKNISTIAISVSSITRIGNEATVTTVSNHSLANGFNVTISGANETEYNGTFAVKEVTAANKFVYDVLGTPSSPATGTISASYLLASIDLKSIDFGQSVNLSNGEVLNIGTPIANVNDTATVQFDGISGGTDTESDDEFRIRIQNIQGNYFGNFSESAIDAKAKEVSGVTRGWVFPITPNLGQVTYYFVRDNDDNIIPSGAEVTAVKNKILEIKPANTDDADVIVSAPTPQTVNFIFSAISPNTDSMKTAITASLQDFFKTQTNVSEDIKEVDYNSAIINTVDTETGQKLETFTLSSPSGNISISTGELGILGTVSF